MHDDSGTVLDLSDVSMVFPGGEAALSSVSISVRSGEFVSVVGPSGCGKSTVLRIAAGLQIPTSGTVRVTQASTGFVFQDPTLMPWRTVRGNASLLLELDGTGREETDRRVRDALRTVDLEDHADKHPHQLSGGMRMRNSLARTLATEPTLLLLDEPFGSLDEMSRERLNDDLLTIRDGRGFAALMVTHSVNEAVYMSNRVFVMAGSPGRVTHEIEVPLGPQRSAETRYGPEYVNTCREVHGALRGVRS